MDSSTGITTSDTKETAHLSQLAQVGQIAAGIAHEVRNPLTVVKGFLQLLQKKESHKYIDIAQSELDNAITTLNNLLQVSKPDLEDEENQTFHLSAELESILNLFQDKLYQIELITNFKHTDATITGKRNQFKKAFFNLIKNAIEAMEDSGVLTVTHEMVDDCIIVTIQDTGAGIPEDKLSLLGTPFFSTKDKGTGMGLTQVFSIVYQHGGKIIVKSKVDEGTTFTIQIPKNQHFHNRGVKNLQLKHDEHDSIKDFLFKNKESFEKQLLDEAINVKDKIEEIHNVGNINLLANAHRMILLVVDDQVHELISFAKQEGIAWAKYSLTLAFILDWLQAIRRTLWNFLYNYYRLQDAKPEQESFIHLEKKINELIDQFFTHFFISYSKYKDELIESQRKLVENLSVPIIPINDHICVLPLVGTIDEQRIETIQHKIFTEIETKHIQILIVDLSGVAHMEQDLTDQFLRIAEGLAMMGCRTVITGLRAEIIKILIKSNRFSSNRDMFGPNQIQFKGTLQQALNDVFFQIEGEQ